MSPIRDDVRIHMRQLFFTEHLSIEEIAERLGFSVRTVRRAVVIDGGAERARGARARPPARDHVHARIGERASRRVRLALRRRTRGGTWSRADRPRNDNHPTRAKLRWQVEVANDNRARRTEERCRT